jgi:cyclase
MPKRVVTILALLLCALPALAQDWDSFEFSAVEIADGLRHVRGAGGNVVMCAGEDGVLLVDADYEQLGEKLVAFVQAETGGGVDYVVATHWHFDHTGGNEALANSGATLIAHENVRRRMAVETRIELLDHTQPAAPAAALPGITFSDSLVLRMNGEEIVVFHLCNAHTDGDAVVIFRNADVIHTGDIVFNCGYPFIDTSCGGDIDGMIAAVETIIGLCGEETTVVPGHGPICGRADLETYLGILTGYRDAVAPLKAEGLSLDEVKAAAATTDIDAVYGAVMFPPDLFTAMVYDTVGD